MVSNISNKKFAYYYHRYYISLKFFDNALFRALYYKISSASVLDFKTYGLKPFANF